ncbi:MAG TPA: ADP-forming succinate--CoA ligase subunit beta [Acidimicrobiales bacterium]|nr:ADP-forming succinate--CoA ligase subunit beta [Acidimicrobiales bacterium]
MDLFEYQGKQFLAGMGVPVPAGAVADTPDQAVAAAGSVGYPVAVKAQVRVGGRGKAGGIRLVRDGAEARAAAEAILGLDIRGHVVRRLWLEAAADVAEEYYASFTVDRAERRYLGMLSARGGVDIEEVAASEPEAIARLPISPNGGLSEADARSWAEAAGLASDVHDQAAAMLVTLFGAFTGGDADLVEVNPLIVTADRRLVALDAKVSLDDSARFRHPEWEEWGTAEWHDERERRARERGLNYVGLTGTVGVIGNGAGLVLSTLDVVSQAGGTPANFLDVGGGASADVIAAALEVVDGDEKVRAVLVNIFGGITRCDEVARGILDAMGRVDLRSPIVVRLDGTNADEGRALLADHQSDRLVSQPTMLDAAQAAVALAAGG